LIEGIEKAFAQTAVSGRRGKFELGVDTKSELEATPTN
jgi:hypothetical protein